MQFLKDLLRNLAILIVIGLVAYFMYPDMIKQVCEIFGLLFGPFLILMVLFTLYPKKGNLK